MSATLDKEYQKIYQKLIKRFPLRPIRSEAENELAAKMCDTLVGRKDLSQAEMDYLEVLSDLIGHFESQWDEPSLSPRELIKYLMEANDLEQKDRVPYFGTRSRVSEFLSGHRDLSVEQAKKLAERFKLKLEPLLR